MTTKERVRDWSEWRPFPNLCKCEYIHAPFGSGVYELRNAKTGELVLYGKGNNVAYRMTSLLPPPQGQGTRKNTSKCEYVLAHLDDIEYRTLPCTTAEESADEERKLQRNKQAYIFQS